MKSNSTVKRCVACGSVLKQYKTVLEQYVREGVHVMRCWVCGCEMCISCGSSLKHREVGAVDLQCIHCGYVVNIRGPRAVVK